MLHAATLPTPYAAFGLHIGWSALSRIRSELRLSVPEVDPYTAVDEPLDSGAILAPRIAADGDRCAWRGLAGAAASGP